MRTMQVEMRRRSRRESAAIDDGLCTPPGKRRVLSVVLSASIIPRQTKRAHVALRCMGEREAIRGRMAGVVEMERLRRVGIDSLGRLSRDLDEARRLDGPLGAV